MSRASLTQKIVLPLGAMVLLLQIGLGAYALDHERRALTGQLDARAARLANICTALELSGEQLSQRQIAQWLGDTLMEQTDVVFCELALGESQTLFRQGSPEGTPCRRYAFSFGSPDATVTDDAPPTGTLYLALSTSHIEQALTEMRGTLAVSILAGTALILLFGILLVRHVIGNVLTRLLRQVQAVSIRHAGRLISSSPHDPLAQLSETLDAMSSRLQETVEQEKQRTVQMMAEQHRQKHDVCS